MITYDRATTKLLYGIPQEHEYGRWNGTFGSGITSWRRLAQQRVTVGDKNTLRILVVGCGLGLLVEGLRDEGWQRVWGISLNDYFASLWDTIAGSTVNAMTVNTGAYMNTATGEWMFTATPPEGWVAVGGFFVNPTIKAQTPIAYGNFWPCEVRADVRPLLGKYDIRTMTTTNVGTLTGLSGAQRSFDLIITEDVMTAYGTAEHEAVYAACDARLAGGGQVRHMVSVGYDGRALGGAPPRTLAEWTATLGGRTNHQFQDIAGVADALAAR